MVGLVLAERGRKFTHVVVAGRHRGCLLHVRLVWKMVSVFFRRIQRLPLVGLVGVGYRGCLRHFTPCDAIDDHIRFTRMAEADPFGWAAGISGTMEPSALWLWWHIRPFVLCVFRTDVYGGCKSASVIFGAGGRLFVWVVVGGAGISALVLVW